MSHVATKNNIILEGFLKKKSPKAFLGRHVWQERYFVLWDHQLCYYKRKEDVGDEDLCLGFLLIENMSGVTSPTAKYPTRFNIILEGVDRQFELSGATDSITRQWVNSLRNVLKSHGKSPVASMPMSPTISAVASGANDRAGAKFWKPQIHKNIITERRQAISAETGALAPDAKTIANRRYEKPPEVCELLYRVIRSCKMAFGVMDEAAMRQVVALMWAQEFEKNDVIVRENMPAFVFSVVVSGALQATSSTNAKTKMGNGAPEDFDGNSPSAAAASPGGLGGMPAWSLGAPANTSTTTSPHGLSLGGGHSGSFSNNNSSTSGLPAFPGLSISTNATYYGGPEAPASPMSGPSAELLTRGHSFGEVALLYDSISSHTIIARHPTLVYTIERVEYKRLVAAASERRFAQRMAFLRTTDLLGQLPEDLLAHVAEALEERHFARGDTIIREGEDGDAFYIIVSGRARARREGKILHEFTRPGEYFGERALIKNETRGATITAVTDVEVLFLTRRDFVDLMGRVEEVSVRGVRKYSLLNRELDTSFLAETRAPTSLAFDDMNDAPPPPPPFPPPRGGAIDTVVEEEEDDDAPPPPPPPPPSAPVASARPTSTSGGTTSVGGIRMHYGGSRSGPATPQQPLPLYPLPEQPKEVPAIPIYDPDTKQTQIVSEPPHLQPHQQQPQQHKRSFLVPPKQPLPDPHAQPLPSLPAGGPAVPQRSGQQPQFHTPASPTPAPGKAPAIPQRPSTLTSPSQRTGDALASFQPHHVPQKQVQVKVQRQSRLVTNNVPQFKPVQRPQCNVKSLSDLRVIGTLGRGTFGHVQLVADREDNTYALKAVNKQNLVIHNQIPHILNERAVMMDLDHPFVVRLFRTLRDRNFLYFLLEPSLGGELFSVLRARDHFDDPTAQFYAATVVSVFDYLHSKDTLYRDLKPENLLLDRDGYLRVTDFGFAKKTRDRTYTFCGTPDYLPPEIVGSAGHHTGADWWTLGILIYEMLAGYTPFYDDAGPAQMYSKILAGKVSYPSTFSAAAKDIIGSLLQTKPTRRLGVLHGGAALIRRHPWFAGLDWQALHEKKLTPPITVPIKDKFDLSNFDAYPAQDEGNDEYVVDPANPEWDHVF